MNKRSISLIVVVLSVALASCTTDPEGPVTERFLDDGSYGAGDWETVLFPVNAVSGSTVPVPTGVGKSSLLKIGTIRGIRFDAILLKFDLTLSEEDSAKLISEAFLDLPGLVAAVGELEVNFYELMEDFGEEDTTVTEIPPIGPTPIPDSEGHTDPRILNKYSENFSIDTTIVRRWLDGSLEHHGIAIIWMIEEPLETLDTLLIETYSHDYGEDPPVIRVEFTDGTSAVYPDIKDYSIATFEGEGLDCVGGVATRIFFDFDLEGIPIDSAMVHASFLVLTVKEEDGHGATSIETENLSLSTDFIYYLYTPDSSDPGEEDFYRGTGVDRNSFNPTVGQVLKIPLRGFLPDVVEGLRENTGLVLQSDLEKVRFQRASFYTSEDDSILRPYIEVVYSKITGLGE